MKNSVIVSCGSYLPKKIITNFDLEKTVQTTNQWILERTGIKQRHIAADGEMTSDLGYMAAKEAINKSSILLDDIDMIVVATTTPDLTFPSTATLIQAKLGITKGFAFDIQAVCSGFVYAVNIANNFIKTEQVRNALVIGVDVLSRIVDWQDRNSCILFGDGAGAVLLSATDQPNQGIIANTLYSNGEYADILNTTGGVSSSGKGGFITMNGKEVFKHAVEKMSQSIIENLTRLNLKVDDIDLLIPHQANARILSAVAKRIGLPEERVIVTVDQHANTSAASIPLALDYALKENRIKKGDLIVFEALGGGLTWGTILLRW